VSQSQHNWSDEQAEQVIGTLLRVGVITAASIVLLGGICYLIRLGSARPDYQVFKGEPSELRSVSGIIHNLASLRCRGLIQFGLIFLIATPVARVAFSVFAFLRERDHTYVVITLIVLAVLIYSLVGKY
jgi:uncharacterized membrane protein